MFKIFSTLIVSSALVGCSFLREAPRTTAWDELKPVSETVTKPVSLPPRPEPIVGEDLIGFDDKGRAELLALLEAGEANTEIAVANSNALEEISVGYNALLRAGEGEHELAEIRKETLIEERRNRMWERFGYWGLLGILGVAAAQ